MAEQCREFVAATAPDGDDLVRVNVKLHDGNKLNDRFVFNGDSKGERVKVEIVGVCKRTQYAVTEECFKKYCGGKNHSECPRR